MLLIYRLGMEKIWNYCYEKLFLIIIPSYVLCYDHSKPILPFKPFEANEPMNK